MALPALRPDENEFDPPVLSQTTESFFQSISCFLIKWKQCFKHQSHSLKSLLSVKKTLELIGSESEWRIFSHHISIWLSMTPA